VAVKVAKEQHDLRFDLPCVGAATVETCVASGIGVLAFEPGRALLLERDSVEGLVRRKGFALLSTPAA
jgi:hypothetical protein